MDWQAAGVIASVVVIVLGAVYWLNNKFSERITRKEHEQAVVKAETDMKERFQTLKEDIDGKIADVKSSSNENFTRINAALEKQDTTDKEFRHSLNNTLQTIVSDLAVLKATKNIAADVVAELKKTHR